MGTIVTYPVAVMPLDGTEEYAAFQNGQQITISGSQLGSAINSGAAAAAVAAVTPLVNQAETANAGASAQAGLAEASAVKAAQVAASLGDMDSPWPRGAHKAWRIVVSVAPGQGTTQIAALQFRATPGGADQAVNGVAGGTADDPTYGPPRYAFDANASSNWIGYPGAPTLAYIFADPVSVNEIAVTAGSGPLGPNAITVEYSDDTTTGVDGTWTTAWAPANQAGWANGETRTFADPLYGQAAKRIALVNTADDSLGYEVGGVFIPVPTGTAADPIPAPVPQRRRLKAATYLGAPPVPLAADPITVTVAETSQLANGVVYGPTNPKVRLLGGTPYTPSPYVANIVYQSYLLVAPNQPKSSNSAGTEILLPASVTQVEFFTLDQGYNENTTILLDGVRTNTLGYNFQTQGGTGHERHVLINLPASTGKPRRLRIWGSGLPQGGFTLPAGSPPLLDPTPSLVSSIYYEGDSITEGAVAGLQFNEWFHQSAARLGIDNPINGGVGSSGYIAYRDYGGGNIGSTAIQRLPSVAVANNGGPPDALVVALGINDPDDLGAAALAYLQAARALLPDTSIIVLGPWSGYGGYAGDVAGHLVARRDAIFAAASQVARIDTVDVDGWITPANSPLYFNTDANGNPLDGPHPNAAGHAYYGMMVERALRPIFERQG